MMNKKTLLIGGAVIVVVLGTAIGYGLYQKRAETAPDVVVNRFYNNWIAALEDPTGPIEQRLHEKSTYVTDEFARLVARENERGRDVVLCGATEPVNYYALRARKDDATNRASVDFKVNELDGHAILVRDERGWWRIDEIDCEAPIEQVTPTATSTLQ